MKKWLLALVPIVILAVSCGKDNPENKEEGGGTETTLSNACNLNSLRFKASENIGIVTDASARIMTLQGKPVILVTVPESADITALIPSFNVSKGAKVKVGSTIVEAGKTKIDFSNVLDVTITSESGARNNKFTIRVKKGIESIDNDVYSIMEKYNIPGIGIATTKNEAIAYASGYGFSNVDAFPMTPVRPDMLFRLASMSKAQTALCIMTLVEEGKLSLDDYVFAPGTGILAEMYEGEHGEGVDRIKIRHLLTHTSGWQYATTDGVDPIFTGDSRFYGKSLKERVAYMVKTPTSKEPGTTSSYYNLGFCVLGQVIEQVTGESYESYLRSVVAKAGVTDIWVAKTEKKDRRENECVYYPQGASTAYGNDMSVVGACGAVIASPLELMKLLCAEDYGDIVPDILTSESLDKLYTNYTTSGKGGYGFGWRIGHNTLTNWASYHGGNISGTATIWVRGKNKVNGVLLCNSRSQIDGFDTALYLALDAIMTKVYQLY